MRTDHDAAHCNGHKNLTLGFWFTTKLQKLSVSIDKVIFRTPGLVSNDEETSKKAATSHQHVKEK